MWHPTWNSTFSCSSHYNIIIFQINNNNISASFFRPLKVNQPAAEEDSDLEVNLCVYNDLHEDRINIMNAC